MKAKSSEVVDLIPLVTPPTDNRPNVKHFLEVEVRYDKGGLSIFGGSSRPRGYYLSVAPITTETRDGGFTSKGFMLFSGKSIVLDTAKAFSVKRFTAIVEAVKAGHYAAHVDELKAAVIAKNKLTVSKEVSVDSFNLPTGALGGS